MQSCHKHTGPCYIASTDHGNATHYENTTQHYCVVASMNLPSDEIFQTKVFIIYETGQNLSTDYNHTS